jgi:hypothetical protein
VAKKKRPTALYFTTVVAVEDKTAILGGHLYSEGAEPSVTRIVICDGTNWGFFEDFDDVVYAMTKKPVPGGKDTLCILGREGHYQEVVSRQPPADARLDTTDGYLMDLRYIAGSLYACGVQNQVYRQKGKRWVRMDQGTFEPLEDEVTRTFESIDGFAENDIYAVGDGGAIWHWDGKRWTELDSPTDYPFYCVLCASSGDAYIGGSNGLLFKGGRDKGWTDLSDAAVTDEVLEDMTEFHGRVYVTATEVLVSTDGGPIEEVKVPVRGDKAYYAIDSGPEFLWCVGDECVLQFDGKKWVRHICPDNA